MSGRAVLWVGVLAIAATMAFQGARGGSGQPVQLKPEAGRVPGIDLDLVDLQGTPFRLSEYKGKVLVVNYWAPWCPPCRREMPALGRLARELAPKGVEFVGIALQSWERSVRGFVDSSEAGFRMAMASGIAGSDVSVLPTTVVLDRSGRVAARLVGEIDESALRSALRSLAGEARTSR